MSAETIFDQSVLVTVKHAASQVEHKTIPPEQRKLQFHIALMRQARGGSTDMVVRVTDEADAYFLYTLQLTEEDFAGLRRSQDIKVDYASFPRNFIQLLERCGSAADTRYLIELELPPDGSTSGSLATLGVIETNDFKNLTHLCLKFVPGNDSTVKKHLAVCLKTEKECSASLRMQLDAVSRDLSAKVQQAEHMVRTTSEELIAVRTELATATSRLQAEHAAAMTHLKENALQNQTALQNRAAQMQRELEDRAQQQIDHLHAKLSETNAAKDTLSERLHETENRLENLGKELASAHARAEEATTTGHSLREENAALRNDCQRHEATLHDNRVTLAQLTQELKGKHEVEKQRDRLADSTQLRVDELQSALREETTKYKELEGRYTATVGEISKGNGIIAKLQSDLSTLHAKLDSRSAVVVRQEQAISAKEHDNQRLQRALEDAHTQRDSNHKQIATLTDQVTMLQADVEERERTLKNNEGIITWLNKQLTDVKRGSTTVDLSLHHLYHTTTNKGARTSVYHPTTDTAGPNPHHQRVPLAAKVGSTMSEANRRHVVYSRGDPSTGATTGKDAADVTLMDKYLPFTTTVKTVSPPQITFPGEENMLKTRIPRAKQHTPPVLESSSTTPQTIK